MFRAIFETLTCNPPPPYNFHDDFWCRDSMLHDICLTSKASHPLYNCCLSVSKISDQTVADMIIFFITAPPEKLNEFS